MKKQRLRIKAAVLLLFMLFALLGFYGIWSVNHYGSRWFSYAGNPRLASLLGSVIKGDILDRNGTVLATTLDGQRKYHENAAVRSALVHVIGDRQRKIGNGVESFHAGYLYGVQPSLPEALMRLTHPNEPRRGNNVTLTVDAEMCAAVPGWMNAHPLSRGKSGAVIVMNYLTGEILTMNSFPVFDPGEYPEDRTADDLSALDHPYFNRATQALIPPGSTFKIITAAAAMERLPGVETRTFTCSGALPVSDSFTVRDFSHAVHGEVTLRKAFANSCNPVFATLALELGDSALRSAAQRFGFNRNYVFRDVVVENSVYPAESQGPEALAASGYGQSALAVTPLHLCLISAAVANDGRMPEPRLIHEVRTASGSPVLSFSSASAGTVCSPKTAAVLQSMMKDVVQSGGSGSRASVSTLDIRGKTGTAESTSEGRPISYGWFTGYCAQKDLPFAVCVLVEDLPDGETGGTAAAPIAREIFTYLKNHPVGPSAPIESSTPF